MFSFYEQLRRDVERIVQYQLDTGEQIKELWAQGEEQRRWWESLPPEEQQRLLAAYQHEDMLFRDTSFIRPECPIGVFMDYQKYKPKKEKMSAAAPMHYHNYFEMFYVYRGHCFSVIEGDAHEFKAGDLCLYSLQARHYCYLPSDDDIIFNFIIRQSAIDDTMMQMLSASDVFSGFFMDSLCNTSRRTSMSFRAQRDEELSFFLLKMILTYFEGPVSCNSLMRSLLVCLFHELAGQYKLQSDAKSSQEQGGVSISSIIEYIEGNYKDITLQQTAEYFYYDPRSLSRFIQKYTGKKFSQIVQEIKLKKACNLLCDPQIPLDSIPAIVGYSDRHYVDKLFRQAFGTSMLKYRSRFTRDRV